MQPPSYPPPDDIDSRYAGATPQYVAVQTPRVKPVVTYTLIGVTVAVFLLQLAGQYLLGQDIVTLLGVKSNELILAGQVWRLITPVFLHSTGFLLHIAFNMYALAVLGPGLEQHYNHGRFLSLYMLAGYAGNVLSFLFSNVPSLGASTAIFGLIGAEGVFLYKNRALFGPSARRALTNVIVIAAINLFLGLSPGSNIDNWGHIGGLVGGTLFAWFAGPRYRLEGMYYSPRLLDENDTGSALRAGLTIFALFSLIVALKFFLA
jgi:rhomboid protease GluP